MLDVDPEILTCSEHVKLQISSGEECFCSPHILTSQSEDPCSLSKFMLIKLDADSPSTSSRAEWEEEEEALRGWAQSFLLLYFLEVDVNWFDGSLWPLSPRLLPAPQCRHWLNTPLTCCLITPRVCFKCRVCVLEKRLLFTFKVQLPFPHYRSICTPFYLLYVSLYLCVCVISIILTLVFNETLSLTF